MKRNLGKESRTYKNMMGPVVMGIAGAAALGATAIALSNKKVRKQAGRIMEDVLDGGKEIFGQLQDKIYMQVRELGEKAKKAITEERVKTGKKLTTKAGA